MAYRQTVFANDQIYHIFNRGVEKRHIFNNKRDYERFIETMDYYRINNPFTRFSFKNRSLLQNKNIKYSPFVEILCFCLMPNHFHILVRQIEENGITKFVSKLTNSYTKYFNTKHNRVGPLLQGTFKSVRIENDEQLLHVSRYIHLNPLIDYLTKDLKSYPYSSYTEFIGPKEGFCQKGIILGNFSNTQTYEQFVLDQEDYGRSIKRIERVLHDKSEN